MMTRQDLRRRFARQVLAGLLGLSTAWAADQKPPDPISWALNNDGPSQAIKPGSVFKVQIEARIEQGWHLYSTEQPAGGPRPTRIILPPDQVFEAGGPVESPAPLTAHDDNFDIETEFYEEAVIFTLPVRVVARAPAGTYKLQVEVRFQSCTNQLCLPPRTIKLDLSVEVAKSS
ncbi:MAG TPA: protein-disulfide reductase DsbD N-terminal domain-containing protein [Blastocatellia bacterium]|nr:protein-disulfide reductase DsbD N-terminal domain-containing protein [Blastocatellia bacterium]